MSVKPARTLSSPCSHWSMPILLVTFASTLSSQEARTAKVSDAALGLPQFEVASVKPTDISGDIKVAVQVYPGGRVEIAGYELKGLIGLAFQPWRISGGADWTEETKYDIEAVPPQAMQSSIKDLRAGSSDARLRQMLQALLINRFALRFHRETVTGTVYLLEKSGKPLPFRPASVDPSTKSRGWRPIVRQRGQWILDSATMAELARRLSGSLGSPVVDRTGLSGAYDYRQRSPDLDSEYRADFNRSFLNFFSELQLKLRKSKGPIETFVIDGAERPSPN